MKETIETQEQWTEYWMIEHGKRLAFSNFTSCEWSCLTKHFLRNGFINDKTYSILYKQQDKTISHLRLKKTPNKAWTHDRWIEELYTELDKMKREAGANNLEEFENLQQYLNGLTDGFNRVIKLLEECRISISGS